MIPIYLNARNLLTPLRAMVERLAAIPAAGPIVIVDNASTWPPLLAWYAEIERAPGFTPGPIETRKIRIVRLRKNRGELAPFQLPSRDSQLPSPFFAVSDPDLDISGVPDDFLAVLAYGLNRHPHRVKAGLSLRIDDLPPEAPFTRQVLRHESRFWQRTLPPSTLNSQPSYSPGVKPGARPIFYDANVGLTFAVYRGPIRRSAFRYAPALRAAPPYTARHLPWYLTPETLDDEWRYYFQHAEGRLSGWSGKMRRLLEPT